MAKAGWYGGCCGLKTCFYPQLTPAHAPQPASCLFPPDKHSELLVSQFSSRFVKSELQQESPRQTLSEEPLQDCSWMQTPSKVCNLVARSVLFGCPRIVQWVNCGLGLVSFDPYSWQMSSPFFHISWKERWPWHVCYSAALHFFFWHVFSGNLFWPFHARDTCLHTAFLIRNFCDVCRTQITFENWETKWKRHHV